MIIFPVWADLVTYKHSIPRLEMVQLVPGYEAHTQNILVELNTFLHVLHLNLHTSPPSTTHVLCLCLVFTDLFPLKLLCCRPLSDVTETATSRSSLFGRTKLAAPWHVPPSHPPCSFPYPVGVLSCFSRGHCAILAISLCCSFITRKLLSSSGVGACMKVNAEQLRKLEEESNVGRCSPNPLSEINQ